MMDGRDSVGRKISLLNDSAPTKVQLPPLLHSRTSSCQSTPSLEPETPLLIRSSSSDSRSFSTPSPLTPTFTSFQQASRPLLQKHQSQQQHSPYAKMDDPNASMYPPLPDPNSGMPSAYPMPHMPPQQPMMQPQNLAPQALRGSNSPASEPSHMSNASAQSGNKSQPKKNQYPCPMAKQVGCTDFFTTSGHAARHAKKHTGKKDAFCPECNKAFTRKDNMEQHRRTHQNGRGASRSSNDESKVKKNSKQAAKKPTKAESQLEAAVEQQLADQAQAAQAQQVVQDAQAQSQVVNPVTTDPAILMPAAGPYFLNNPIDTGPIPALPMPMHELGSVRPSLQRSNFVNSLEYIAPLAPMVDPDTLHYSYPSPGLSNGLNSLALAASEHSRLTEKAQSARSPSSETSSQETL
ncbi:hypothetical protein AC579_3262 [Lecanosticta acicola]|uniref:C2H2-type domain-containing protein n=1 Tax=Lecanosticta acicola TaxID=111012 RepID=A0AAI8Z444_9PEZI|nr:hypothetical protein AC579_3262 [Lecanosticta acicola]